MDTYQCIHCRQPVKAIHIPGRFISPSWIHLDGYEVCRATYASPNFDKPIIEKLVEREAVVLELFESHNPSN